MAIGKFLRSDMLVFCDKKLQFENLFGGFSFICSRLAKSLDTKTVSVDRISVSKDRKMVSIVPILVSIDTILVKARSQKESGMTPAAYFQRADWRITLVGENEHKHLSEDGHFLYY
jgi:hypothetical protein